jgi:hypothetical protein
MFGLGLWWYRRRLLAAVRKHGWTSVGFEGPESWTYSVGFSSTLSAPEIVLSGVPDDIASGLMWEAFRQIQDGRLVLADGLAWELQEDWKPVWREVHPKWIEHGRLHFALWHFHRMGGRMDQVRAFQLVFADVQSGAFPWEPGFPASYKGEQVAFYQAPSPEELVAKAPSHS